MSLFEKLLKKANTYKLKKQSHSSESFKSMM